MDLEQTLIVNLAFNVFGRLLELGMLWLMVVMFREMQEVRLMLRKHRDQTEEKDG